MAPSPLHDVANVTAPTMATTGEADTLAARP
jgi:hypothetical protein